MDQKPDGTNEPTTHPMQYRFACRDGQPAAWVGPYAIDAICVAAGPVADDNPEQVVTITAVHNAVRAASSEPHLVGGRWAVVGVVEFPRHALAGIVQRLAGIAAEAH